MHMRSEGGGQSINSVHTGLNLSVKETEFFRIFAQKAAASWNNAYGGLNFSKIDPKNAISALQASKGKSPPTVNENNKLPNIHEGRCLSPGALKGNKNWRPPLGWTMKSTFGFQVMSKRVTSPSFGFGTGSRDAMEKVFLVPEAEKKRLGNFSSGPVYKVLSSFGKQSASTKGSPPVVPIGREI